MMLRPITSEKAVRLIDGENTLLFETERRATKTEIKAFVEATFKVKVTSIRTLIKHNTKYAYVALHKTTPAVDLAAKLGMI
jgi:large subunit ribosomal protein L23